MDSAGAVDVSGGGDEVHLVRVDARRESHKGVGLGDLEELLRALQQHDGGERTEGLAVLDLGVDEILDLVVSRVRQDGAVAQRARTHLGAALEPADDLLLAQKVGDEPQQIGFLEFLVNETGLDRGPP